MQTPAKSTDTGKSDGQFPQTQWTRLIQQTDQAEVKEELYQLYWTPLYRLLKRQGYAEEDAAEYAQEFLVDILMGSGFFNKADRKIGKFRSLLAKSCVRFAARLKSRQREPASAMPMDEEQLASPGTQSDTLFDRDWAVSILTYVIKDVERQCRENGLKIHWSLFEQRVILPCLNSRPAPSLGDLCQRFQLGSPGIAANMLVSPKRRFKKTLMRHLSNYAGPGQDLDELWQDFLAIFTK